MQTHHVRNLRGKVLYVALSCAILLVAIRSTLQGPGRQQVQDPPRIHGQYGGPPSPRTAPRTRPKSFTLDTERLIDLSQLDLSYLEGGLLESYESSSDESSYSIQDLPTSADPAVGGNVTLPHFIVNTSSNRFRHGCYERGIIKAKKEPLPDKELLRLRCEQRPPEAIVFGVKKGGTTTLKEFLAFHPGVSVAANELKFLNRNSLAKKGLFKYASLMPYSLPDQIPIEKTPGYLVRPRCALTLKELIPNCKLIAILSDPVKRAISDFVHLSHVRDHRPGGAKELSPKHANQIPHYEVKSTFEESVLYANGSVKSWNTLIDTGIYYKHAKYWLDFFPPENFLYLDSEDLIHNPIKSFKELEQFLGLPPFFSEEVFHFNETKGFFCVRYPVYSCMPSAKGRPHPVVDEGVIRTLREYFEPFNMKFSQLVNRTFSWTTYPELS